MEKLILYRKDLVLGHIAIFLSLSLSLGFGYFIGRYEQIELNKSVLETIPDVNCRKM
jgi:hypothetical protein